jgi:hypothetical protein
MRSVTALLALAIGAFIPPPEPVALHTIEMRWGEFDRSLMTDQLGMLISLEEHGQARRDVTLLIMAKFGSENELCLPLVGVSYVLGYGHKFRTCVVSQSSSVAEARPL